MSTKSKFISFCVVLSSFLFFLSCQNDRFKQGKILYDFHCASCHMEDGTGLANLYPPLNNADYLIKNRLKLPEIIFYGLVDSIMVNGNEYTIPMSGIVELSQVEVSNICNYVLTAWENQMEPIPFGQVVDSLMVHYEEVE